VPRQRVHLPLTHTSLVCPATGHSGFQTSSAFPSTVQMHVPVHVCPSVCTCQCNSHQRSRHHPQVPTSRIFRSSALPCQRAHLPPTPTSHPFPKRTRRKRWQQEENISLSPASGLGVECLGFMA
jgi:hypothetical protein